MNNIKYKKIAEALLPLLESKYIDLGFYIDFESPVVMILDEEGKVKDWIEIDFEIYNILRSYLDELHNTGKESSK